jgi:hypothetical protein
MLTRLWSFGIVIQDMECLLLGVRFITIHPSTKSTLVSAQWDKQVGRGFEIN